MAKHKTESVAGHPRRIKTEAMAVLFIDECHLLNGDICGYVWGQTKIRIEVPIKNEKNRQTYFGALNYQTHKFTIEACPAGNGESTVKFVKNLQRKYPNQKIV